MDDAGEGSCARIKKDSFAWYQRVIATNGEDLGEEDAPEPDAVGRAYRPQDGVL